MENSSMPSPRRISVAIGSPAISPHIPVNRTITGVGSVDHSLDQAQDRRCSGLYR